MARSSFMQRVLTRLRQRDVVQLWLAGMGLVFMAAVAVWGQSQDYINATLTERLNGMELRLGRLETYLGALVAAVLGNLIAHIVEIRGRPKHRHHD